MKILYLYKDYYPVFGGIENYVRQMAEYMQSRGHQVQVLVTNTDWRGQRETIAGVSVTKSGRLLNLASAPVSLTMFSELYRQLLSPTLRPDIIHLQFPYPIGELAWLLTRLALPPGIPRPKTVLSYHSDIVRQRRLLKFYRPFLRQVLQQVNQILVASPQYIASSPWLQPVSEKCSVAPYGVDYARFATAQAHQVAALKAKYALDKLPIILFAGRLRYYKGLQYLLRAMPLLTVPARLLIVGVGAMEAEWKAEAVQLGLGQSVSFVGEVSDENLPAYYQAADIFVLPASERSEAFGIVQLEAMAAGCPVISTELGTGTSYVNQNGETGLVVPPADPVALAAALNQLLTDSQLRQQMASQAQTRVRTEFTIERMTSRTESIYRQIIGAKDE